MGFADFFKNTAPLGDELLAKACVYAWSAVILADGQATNKELGLLNTFARANDATKNFYSETWIGEMFEEAIKIYKNQGMDALIAAIPPMFANATENDRRIVLYNLMMLATSDGDFDSKEMGVIKTFVDAVDMPRDDVLFTGMIFASNQ